MAKKKQTKRIQDPAPLEEQQLGSGSASEGSSSDDFQEDPALLTPKPVVDPPKGVFWASVNIDQRTFDVNYGTEENFLRLLRECALEAATKIPRPTAKGRFFFRCVHCLSTRFTSKIRLNKHRWDSECPAVKDDMGNPKRLLPYPDQGNGQGKTSEMIRKGKDAEVTTKVVRRVKGKNKKGDATVQDTAVPSSVLVDGDSDHVDVTEVHEEGTRAGVDMELQQPEKSAATVQVLEAEENIQAHEDMEFPPTAEDNATDGEGMPHASNLSKPREQDSAQGTVGVVEQSKHRKVPEADVGDVGDCIADRTKRRRSAEQGAVDKVFWQPHPPALKVPLEKAPHVEHCADLDDDSPIVSEEHVSAKTAANKPNQKTVREPIQPPMSRNIGDKDSSSDDLSFRYMVHTRTKSPLGLQGDTVLEPETPNEEGALETALLMEPTAVTLPAQKDKLSVPLSDTTLPPADDPIWQKLGKFKTMSAKKGFLKRSPEREIAARALEELHMDKRMKPTRTPSPRKRRLTHIVISSDSEEQQQKHVGMSDTVEPVEPLSPDPADARQTLGPFPRDRLEQLNNDVETYGEDLEAQLQDNHGDEDLMEDQQNTAVTSPESPAKLKCSASRVACTSSPKSIPVSSTHLDVVPWTGNLQGNSTMQRYWLCGLGSPEPTVHPDVALKNPGRVERLDKDEQGVRMKAAVEAEAMAASSTKPKPPQPCQTPDLVFLLTARPQLLDWDYHGQTAEEFMKSFSCSWEKGIFQDSTRACSMWWFCEAKEEDYPDVSTAIGRAVTSICRSVKYKEMPPDVELFAKYLQHLRDLQSYEDSLADLRLRQQQIVEKAVQEFRRDTEFRRESYRWDWCPLWWVVSQVNVFRKLPPLPWRHDDEEADEVRRILLAKRVPHMSAPHFVKVLRIAMTSVLGRFRQFTCPIFGVNRAALRAMCRSDTELLRAVGIYTSKAPFRFAGIQNWEPHAVHDSVMRDSQVVCEGKEDHVLDGVMEWVESVRARALQDLALHHPAMFRTCWRTTTCEQWGEQSKMWDACLRMREDFDIGWVAEVNQPQWAIRVKSIQHQILHLVHSLAAASEADDEAAWANRLSNSTASAETVHSPGVPTRIAHQESMGEGTASAEGPLPLQQRLPPVALEFPVNVDDISTQDLEIDGLSVPVTPPTLIGLIFTQSEGGPSTVDVLKASPRSLEEVFHAISLTPYEALSDDKCSDDEVEKVANAVHEKVTANDPELLTRVRHAKAVTFVPLHVKEQDSKRWNKLSIRKAYDFFTIDELIEALPRRGSGDKDMGTVNFFGDANWDALPVPICQIVDLQRMKRFLGQNIVELLSRRLWWSLSAQARQKVYVAPSFMQAPLQHAWATQSDEALIKWGREYLVPSRFYKSCPPDIEVLVPYVGGLHWSLIILTSTQISHLDSGGMHEFAQDLEYIKRLRKVWELLHDSSLTLPPVEEKVKCFSQFGSYECGYCVLRFMESYLRIFHGDDPVLDTARASAMFHEQVNSPERGRELQKNVIAAVADELGASTASELYDRPYRVMYAPHRESSPEFLRERKKGDNSM